MGHGKDVLDELGTPVRDLRQRIPAVFDAYGSLNAAVFRRRRTRRQYQRAHRAGLALGVAVLMNGGPGTVHAPRALAAFLEFRGDGR